MIYKSYQKSLACFCYLATFLLFLLYKGKSKREALTQCSLKYATAVWMYIFCIDLYFYCRWLMFFFFLFAEFIYIIFKIICVPAINLLLFV